MIFQTPLFLYLNMEILLIFGTIICLIFAGKLAFHYYNKNKEKIFLESLSGKNIIRLNDIDTDIDVSSSKSLYNYQINKSTIILLDNHIFLLTRSKIFNVAQPILQISKIGNNENFPCVWEEINYISKQQVDYKIKIKGFSKRRLTKINYRIILDFTDTKFDLAYFKLQ